MAVLQESFACGDSLFHRLDTRMKVLSAFLLIIALALLKTPMLLMCAFVLSCSLLIFAQLPWRLVLRRFFMVNVFTAFFWVMLPVTYGGENLDFSGFLVSQSGVILAGLLSLKINAIFCIVLALLTTSTVADLGRAMQWWRVPKKICLLLLFSYRYIFVIHEEYLRLRRAASMRCFVPRSTILTYRIYGNLVGMTLVRSYNRALRVGQAMELRCFQGNFHSLELPDFDIFDFMWGILLCSCAAILFVLDVL